MSDFIEIPIENIIVESQTTTPGFCNTKYVVYFDESNPKNKVRVNTHYFANGNTMSLCKYYDRGLCNTVEEYKTLDISYIESQAYGAWMDGAH